MKFFYIFLFRCSSLVPDSRWKSWGYIQRVWLVLPFLNWVQHPRCRCLVHHVESHWSDPGALWLSWLHPTWLWLCSWWKLPAGSQKCYDSLRRLFIFNSWNVLGSGSLGLHSHWMHHCSCHHGWVQWQWCDWSNNRIWNSSICYHDSGQCRILHQNCKVWCKHASNITAWWYAAHHMSSQLLLVWSLSIWIFHYKHNLYVKKIHPYIYILYFLLDPDSNLSNPSAVMTMVKTVISLLQVMVQTPMIIDGLRRCSNSLTSQGN